MWAGASASPVVVCTTGPLGATTVSKAVKKAISLPADLAAEAEAIARDENKSLSAVVQDALRALKRSRLRTEFRELQGYWSARARDKGVLSERELARLLRR
jgi:Arc/MetJ-type ribon-helix-helix transcriptional regulator